MEGSGAASQFGKLGLPEETPCQTGVSYTRARGNEGCFSELLFGEAPEAWRIRGLLFKSFISDVLPQA